LFCACKLAALTQHQNTKTLNLIQS
jgi:hypothetical protein